MKLAISIIVGALAAMALMLPLATGPASARVEFGAPDFPNYLAPPGHGTCAWWTEAYIRACPTAAPAPVVVSAPVALPTKAKKR